MRQVFEFATLPTGMQLDPIRDARIYERLEALDGLAQVNHERKRALTRELLPTGRVSA